MDVLGGSYTYKYLEKNILRLLTKSSVVDDKL